MPLDSSIIEENEPQNTDYENGVFTIFSTLEDENFKIEDRIEGFLISTDKSKSYWIYTEVDSTNKNSVQTSTEKVYASIPRKDSPEGIELTKAIKTLAIGYNGTLS